MTIRLLAAAALATALTACGDGASSSAAPDAATPPAAPADRAPAEAAAISTAAVGAAATGAPTPEAVRAAIARDGARAAVTALDTGSDGEATPLDAVFARMAEGDDAYLALAPQLSEGVEPLGATDDANLRLLSALQTALPRNPLGVLRLTSPRLPVADVCRAGAGAAADEEEAAFTARAVAAVQGVSDAEVARQQEACLSALRGGDA